MHRAIPLFFGLSAILMAETSMAADVAVQSKVDSVVVYPAGAEVSRTAKIKLEAGEHVLILSDLPAQVIANSLRVAATAAGRLDIASVDSRQRFVLATEGASVQSARRQLEDEKERLGDERAVLLATVQAAETQRQLMQNLANLPNNPGQMGHQAAQPTDWSQVFSVIGNRMTEAQRVVIGAQVTIRGVDRKIQDVDKQLRELQAKQEARTEVKIFVSAPAALEGDLTVRYQVPSASWTPLYDARLSAATKAVAPKVTLTRRAAIRQHTGEAWDNVALTLSTARPNASTSAPELRPFTVDFYEPPVPVPMSLGQAAPAAPPVRQMARRADAMEDKRDEVDGVAKAKMMEATAVAATVETSPFQALFIIKDRVTVPANGETKQVFADETTLDPVLTAKSSPRQDARAYLYAKMTIPRTAPYLPGAVSLFRDQTFVGTGRLAQLTPGEEFELGFGADDLVKVRHTIADEKRGEQGLIRSSSTDSRSFRVAIKSSHERPIQFVIQDSLPVSNNQDIKIDITAKPQPTRRDVDDKRGVTVWEDKLDPEQEKVIEYGWKIVWPAGRQITPIR